MGAGSAQKFGDFKHAWKDGSIDGSIDAKNLDIGKDTHCQART